MTHLPDPPTAPAAGQATPTDADIEQAARLLAALDAIPTSFRDDTPVPKIGDALPIAQPGRPPMSQGAADASALMLSVGVCTVLVGGAVSLVLWASGHADPVVVAVVFGAPTALVLAIARLAKRARPEPEIHNHYSGNVYQQHTTTNSRSIWNKTINK